MKIVISGAGDVGSHLARLLSHEDQDILVIDPDAEKLERLDAKYNLMTLTGNPTSFSTLREAQADQADLFIAVMPSESSNMLACAMAKSLGARRTVGRIENYDYMQPMNRAFATRMGVDQLIYPEDLAAEQIVTALERTWVRHWFEIHDGQIIVVGVRLHGNPPLVGMQLKEFASTNHSFHVSAIKRHNDTIIPRGDDRMLENDILYITTTRDHVADLLALTGKTPTRVRRVLVMGAGKIARRLIDMAGDRFKFTVIDRDIDACRRLSERCPEASVYHGDARDIDLWSDVGIDDIDAFIALTASSETNILACLTAKEEGVPKTIAEVEDIQFINQAEGLNIGSIINKKLLASSKIFQMLIDSDDNNARCLALTDAEVAEFEVRPGAKITKTPIKDVSIPRDITLAGLIRDGHGMLVTGGTHVLPGDRVVVFCLAGTLHKVEKLFK